MTEIKEKLAYAYQILSYLELDDHTYTHLSAAADETSYYIYPFGLRFEEVSKDNLMRVDFNGKVLEGEEYQYNKTGYVIHGSIYKARPDIKSIFHIHTPAIISVSSLKNGLMPINQWALHFYNQITYHNYDSLALNPNQSNNLIDDLGASYIMLLRNHGSLTCGKTIEEAMFYTYHLELACKTQNLTLAMNQEIITPSIATCEKTVRDLLSFEENLGKRDWQAWVRLIDRKHLLFNRN